jgi:hypothetical protein
VIAYLAVCLLLTLIALAWLWIAFDALAPNAAKWILARFSRRRTGC